MKKANSKHTPGPWVAQRDPGAMSLNYWCIGAQGEIDKVAVCSEHDARLIAAAPELLEALKRARPHIGVGYSGIQRNEIMKLVDAAVYKAEGGAA